MGCKSQGTAGTARIKVAGEIGLPIEIRDIREAPNALISAAKKLVPEGSECTDFAVGTVELPKFPAVDGSIAATGG
jgi:hypothetical protein